VFHSAGVHPHDVDKWADGDLERIRAASAHEKCRAIGEIGLDYYYDNSPRELQKQWLVEQLRLASEVALPVVIHSRDAEADLLAALKDYVHGLRGSHVPGVIHCFTGTEDFGRACLDLGFYISFSGILTFKNAEPLRAAAKAFPLERLLVETDSPFLAPIPFRGKKCEPSMVRHTALKLAEIKGVSIEEVAAVTTVNSRRVFRLPG
jgi:TatD DNase family protein